MINPNFCAQFVHDGTQASTLVAALKKLEDTACDESYGEAYYHYVAALPCRSTTLASRPERRPLVRSVPSGCPVACTPAGFKTLPPAAQADVRRRLFRCGLAASLDHTLRLAYSGGGDANAPTAVHVEPLLANLLARVDIAPLLPPTADSSAACAGSACGGQSASSSTGRSGTEAGHQLGLISTLSKRAAVLRSAVEAIQGAAQQQGANQRRQQVMHSAMYVTLTLSVAMHRMQEGLPRRAEAARQEEAGGGGGAACAEDAVVADAAAGFVDEAHEALALAARAACNLAAPLGWKLAADMAAAAAGGPTVQPAAVQAMGMVVVCEMATRLAHMCRSPALLPPAQLLACQPHRLLAAACTLAAALPTQPNELGEHKQRLCALLASAVAVLASHETLSGRARGWLAPPLAAAATSSDESCGGDGGGGGSRGSRGKGQQADPCAGCLAVPLLALVRQAAGTAPSYAAHTAALLRLAGGGEGTGVAPGEADGGFRRFAQGVAEAMVADSCRDAQPCGRFTEVPMPDGSSPTTLLPAEGEGNSAGGMRAVSPPSPLPAAPSTPLPPPLALQPSRQGALTRLRVCGNPHCSNFAGESEGALPFKQCGGCRAVRYCGADCQRAHWREGHRAECKELAAGATGADGTNRC